MASVWLLWQVAAVVRIGRKCRCVLRMLVAATALAVVGVAPAHGMVDASDLPDASATTVVGENDRVAVVRTWYRAWNGRTRTLVIVHPIQMEGPLPLVVSLHPAGGRATCDGAFGQLPARFGFVVACIDGQGVGSRGYSYGAPGQIDDELRVPELVDERMPGLAIDRARTIVTGSSMGGLEALLVADRSPTSFSAVVALDPVVDLGDRFRALGPGARDRVKRDAMIAECGGSPLATPACYRRRSPIANMARLSRSATPVVIQWSTSSGIDGTPQQAPRYAERMRALNPRKELYTVFGRHRHGAPWYSERDRWLTVALGLSLRH